MWTKGKYIFREQSKKKCVNKENSKTWIRKRCFTRKRHCLTCSISPLHEVHNLRFEATMTKMWPCWNWKSTKVDREPQWWIILKLLVSYYYLFFGLKNPITILVGASQWLCFTTIYFLGWRTQEVFLEYHCNGCHNKKRCLFVCGNLGFV